MSLTETAPRAVHGLRVLMLSQVLPYPPDSGPKIKTWNLIKSLSRNHQITLVSFRRDEPAGAEDELRKYCAAVHTTPMRRPVAGDLYSLACSLARRQPWVMVRDERRSMRELVRLVWRDADFDVVHVDQLNMASYAADYAAPCTVLDAHNALWQLYADLAATTRPGAFSLLFARDAALLRSYEARACRAVDAVAAVCAADECALHQICAEADISVIPIAIDPDEIQPVSAAPGSRHILHLGTMFWPPNAEGVQWFVDEVFDTVRRRCSDAELDIVGARPPRRIRRLSKRPQVNVSGYVADTTPYLARAGALIVPLRAASGMRVKILTALAQAMPVVTTTVGCSGIEAESGRHLLIADSPSEFAEAVIRLLRDRSFAEELGRNGRQLIVQRYDYREAGRSMGDVYRKVLDGKAARAS